MLILSSIRLRKIGHTNLLKVLSGRGIVALGQARFWVTRLIDPTFLKDCFNQIDELWHEEQVHQSRSQARGSAV